jgi:hypothetical protein
MEPLTKSRSRVEAFCKLDRMILISRGERAPNVKNKLSISSFWLSSNKRRKDYLVQVE